TEALRTIGDAPADDRSLGRLRFAEARAALGAGDLERVGTLLDSGLVVPDIREGESSLHELWFGYQAARRARHDRNGDSGPVDAEEAAAVPRDLDFRMSEHR
ncbi:MAG: hypothetical protein ACRDO8_08595, partial [Nocardioidaceae bacterium]